MREVLLPEGGHGERNSAVHLTRSRQDHLIDEKWRMTGALDAEGNWRRTDLAKRASAAFTKFYETLDPDASELFQPALTAAWNYYLSALEVTGRLQSPPLSAERVSVLDNRVTVWRGTSPLVVHQVVDGDRLK